MQWIQPVVKVAQLSGRNWASGPPFNFTLLFPFQLTRLRYQSALFKATSSNHCRMRGPLIFKRDCEKISNNATLRYKPAVLRWWEENGKMCIVDIK